MNIKSNIQYGALLLIVSGGIFQACQEDVLDNDAIYDKDTLIAQGRYLTARSTDAYSLQDPASEPQPFEVGTPYRLLAFVKPYDASNPTVESPVAETPRFNKVAWEGKTAGNLRYINIDSEPDKWFGFSALKEETSGTDGLVSLDFYGFTYGVAEDHADDYIALEGWNDKSTLLTDLTHKESVTDGQLKDLMRGVLLNQNIATAGVASTEADGFQNPKPNTQSVIPFKHCFSKLSFQVSQQAKEDKVDADGNPVPGFENLVLEGIEITGTYPDGVVSLADGLVNVGGEKISRSLTFDKEFTGDVTLKNTNVGEIVLFPSDGSSLSNTDMPDGYAVGLNITVKSIEKTDIENMLANTESTGGITEETDAAGQTWYRGTIVKNEIIDYYTDVDAPNRRLYFKQNTAYMLIITFQKDAVRIITVRPQVEEWLPGEGTDADPWQNQAMGQPQMFDNIVWSDRNLGADDYDPVNDYELTIGYFYQAGRNIPYFPYDTRKYNHKYTANGNEFTGDPVPTPADKRKDPLSGETSYYHTVYRLYPMVDERLIKMKRQSDSPASNGSSSSWLWCIAAGQNPPEIPQMFIPETRPTDKDFGFMRGQINQGLTAEQDMDWEGGQQNQPVSGSWLVPSSKDFLSIFPATPFAGNITFRHCDSNSELMNWNGNGEMAATIKTLRVTVPYYKINMAEPTGKSQKYLDAWNTLKENSDAGTTQEWAYWHKPDSYKAEPDGDPEDGYASVYVISRAEGDVGYLPDEFKEMTYRDGNENKKSYVTTEWGTIYAIKRIYTSQAYRLRLRCIANPNVLGRSPSLYLEICRYRCNYDNTLDETNYKEYDWDHPAARIYFPICGLGDWTGAYINCGSECQYATRDAIEKGKTSAVQIKITGDNDHNQYISVVKGQINRNFGMQIRPIARGVNDNQQ